MPKHRPFLQLTFQQTVLPLITLLSFAPFGLAALPSASGAPTIATSSANFSLPSLLGKNLTDYEAALGWPKYVSPAPTDPTTTRWTETRYYKPAVPGMQRVVLSCWVTKGADGTPAPEPLVVRVECQFAPNGPVRTRQAALQALAVSPASLIYVPSHPTYPTIQKGRSLRRAPSYLKRSSFRLEAYCKNINVSASTA